MNDLIVLVDTYPYPANTGGKIAISALIEGLSRYYRIHLVAVAYPGYSSAPEYVNSVHLAEERRVSLTKWETIRAVSAAWIHGLPYMVYRSRYNKLFQIVKHLNKTFPEARLVVGSLQMVQYTHNTRFWLIEPNVEYSLERGRIQLTSGIQRWAWAIESIITRHFEVASLRRAYRILTFSPLDRDIIRRDVGIDDIKIRNMYPPILESWGRAGKEGRWAAIVGSALWPENSHGLKWFLQQVMPHLSLSTRIWVLGEGVGRIVSQTGYTSRVRILEQFRSLSDFISDIRALIVPIQNGSGIRIKILQALEAGLPVISTSMGARGLPVEETGIVIAHTPEDMAEAIMSLETDPETWTERVRKGQQFVKRHCQMDIFSNELYKWLTLDEIG